MDIHAPHQPVHSWRDFFIHIVIVTIGLFLALMLEAGVEWLHHRHIVREARENIRRELEDNHRAAQQDIALIDENIAREKSNIATIHTLMAHPKHASVSIRNTFDFNSPSNAAWHTARDTGALAFMPYDEVERDSDLYSLADFIDSQSTNIADNDFAALAPFRMGYDIDSLPPELYMQLLHDNANVEVHLETLKQIVQQYDAQCTAALKK